MVLWWEVCVVYEDGVFGVVVCVVVGWEDCYWEYGYYVFDWVEIFGV